MNNNTVSYYNSICIELGSGNTSFNGKVYIDENNYCEGIITDESGMSFFLFGTFKKFEFLDLYIVKGNEMFHFLGYKEYLCYMGKYTKSLSDKLLCEENFKVKVGNLETDPRDWENPKEDFKNRLRIFRDNWLTDLNNKKVYDSIIISSGKKNK